MLDPSTLRLLLSPRGQEALEAARASEPRPEDFLLLSQRLERRFPSALAAAAAEQAILREKARQKFPEADRMYFTREALEQATARPVAEYRAARFASLTLLFDLTCGIGGDALALAAVAPVVAADIDRLRVLLLAANAAALGLAGRISPACADARNAPWGKIRRAGAFFDPGRRPGGRRVHSIHDYEPPLGLALEWAGRVDGMGAKISPGVDLAEIAAYDCEIEFIALENELREAVLWFGSLRRGRRRATVLPGPHSLAAEGEPDLPLSAPGRYLYEPSPAVMRAGLVRTLGSQIGGWMLDRTIGFLTSDRLAPTPFARAYEVCEAMPFQLKRLRDRLRQRGIGPLTIKKRGSPLEPDHLIRKLGLRGDVPATVVLTRVNGKPYALIVEPIETG
jgi:hypothetical protein